MTHHQLTAWKLGVAMSCSLSILTPHARASLINVNEAVNIETNYNVLINGTFDGAAYTVTSPAGSDWFYSIEITEDDNVFADDLLKVEFATGEHLHGPHVWDIDAAMVMLSEDIPAGAALNFGTMIRRTATADVPHFTNLADGVSDRDFYTLVLRATPDADGDNILSYRIQFFGNHVANVPGPATLALLSLALLGGRIRRNRRRS